MSEKKNENESQTSLVKSSESARKPRANRWPPGVSGNPKGRPRRGSALAEAVRRKCDPDELVDIALKIATKSKSEAYRLQALHWLRDSGYLRPAVQHEVLAVATTQLDAERVLAGLSDATLRELAQAAAELPAGEGGDDGRG